MLRGHEQALLAVIAHARLPAEDPSITVRIRSWFCFASSTMSTRRPPAGLERRGHELGPDSSRGSGSAATGSVKVEAAAEVHAFALGAHDAPPCSSTRNVRTMARPRPEPPCVAAWAPPPGRTDPDPHQLVPGPHTHTGVLHGHPYLVR